MSHIFRKFSRFIHSFCAFWIKVKISAQVRRRYPALRHLGDVFAQPVLFRRLLALLLLGRFKTYFRLEGEGPSYL